MFSTGENLCSSRFRRPGPRYLGVRWVRLPWCWPELACWKSTGRAGFIAATDAQALQGFKLLSQLEVLFLLLDRRMRFTVQLKEPRKCQGNTYGRQPFPVGRQGRSSVAEVCPNWAQDLTGTCVFEEDQPIKLRETSKWIFVESK